MSSDSVEGREELQPIGAERATEIRKSAATCSRKLFDMIPSFHIRPIEPHSSPLNCHFNE
eukprot:1183481-Prorocentrum_minimum.AAC.6